MYMQKQQRENNQQVAERTLGKTLPSNLEAERAVLSALLLSDDRLSQVSEILLPGDFYSHQHKIIYETILAVSTVKAYRSCDITGRVKEKKPAGECRRGFFSYFITRRYSIVRVG